jgi:hypothetical protein
MYSTVGRPRGYDDWQVAEALEWKRNQKTAGQRARELDLSLRQFFYIAECNGVTARSGRARSPMPDFNGLLGRQ